MSDVINIIIADDHALIRDALEMHLQLEPDIAVVASVADGHALQNSLRQVQETIHIVVADFDMPGSGLLELQRIKKRYPGLKILVITGVQNAELLKQIRLSEMDAVLEKTGESERIIETIRILNAGKTPQNPALTESKPFLTRKEYQVLQLIAEGHSNPAIAEILFVSPKTVDTHRQNIMKKLDVHSTAELIKTAMKQGLIL